MEQINKYIKEKSEQKEKEHKAPADNYFYASAALDCPRKLYYSRTIKKDFPIETLKIFEIGNILHEWVQGRIEGEDEVVINFEAEGVVISGRIDKVEPNGEPMEFKTTSNVSFNRDKPDIKHCAQLNLYLKAKDKKKGKVVYIDKRSLETVEHEIIYDDDLYNETINNFKKVYLALAAKKIPEIPEEYDPKKFPCSYCLYKVECRGETDEKEDKKDKGNSGKLSGKKVK